MYGFHRLFGTMIGGVVMLVYIYMYHQLSKIILDNYGLARFKNLINFIILENECLRQLLGFYHQLL